MFYYVLEEFGKMDQIEMHKLYFSVSRRFPNSLERAYVEMLNMPDASKENICLEFMKARIPFPLVVGLGDLELAEGMISYGVDANVSTARNYRALHMACLQGNLKMAELLLEHNADVNAFDVTNRTPLLLLFSAMTGGWLTDIDNCYLMTRLLVSHGAKLGRRDMESMSMAVMCANLDTVTLLVDEANGDLNYRSNTGGESCLHLAVSNKQPGVLEYVIGKFKGDLDNRDEDGWTPLLKAARPNTRNQKAVKILLESGADFRLRYKEKLASFDLLLGGQRNPRLAWLYFDLGLDVLGREMTSLRRAVMLRSPWTQDIIAEIARKEMMGVPIVGKNRLVFLRDEQARSCLRLCIQQLREMQKMKFHENVSFWNVLSEDQTQLTEYAENLELVRAFFNTKCNGSFSIYCARIRYRFIDLVSRNSLIDLSTLVICDTIKRPTLYEIFQHELMKYMKKEDFNKILGCCHKA